MPATAAFGAGNSPLAEYQRAMLQQMGGGQSPPGAQLVAAGGASASKRPAAGLATNGRTPSTAGRGASAGNGTPIRTNARTVAPHAQSPWSANKLPASSSDAMAKLIAAGASPAGASNHLTAWSAQKSHGFGSHHAAAEPETAARRDFNPAMQRTPMAPASSPSAAVASAAMGVPGLTSRLVEDLRVSSHEELVQLLVELSSYSSEAARFVECKAQALRYHQMASQAVALYGSTAQHLDMNATETPMKQPGSFAASPDATPAGTATAGQSPQQQTSPYQQMESEQHQPPEQRNFCDSERHPCVFQFGTCRNPQSCVFARSPCNLCAAFIRGECPSGSRCTLVHRLPADASPQLRHLYEVKLARRGAAASATARK